MYNFKHSLLLIILLSATAIFSCSKPDHSPHHPKPQAHSTEVLDKWMSMQLRLMRNATGIPNQSFSRQFAYSGVAAFEALKPGIQHSVAKWKNWNGLTGLPQASKNKSYYFPANVNAALANMNRYMFPNASDADKQAIDSLESALKQKFLQSEPEQKINLSSQFGKAVADAVFNWAETDGYNTPRPPYTAPEGPGLWVSTPPAFAPASTPFWGLNRTIVAGSIENTKPPAPPEYSTHPASEFYQMVKHVYDVSQNLTDEQKDMAIFWKDVPGATSPGHWLSILQQALRNKNVTPDKAALAYALVGTAINDGLISCFKWKYHYNLIRPVTYIRDVMGHSSWLPFLGTPPHPEYVSAHSNLSAAAALIMEKLLGNSGTFTDHTYDYLGMQPRTYSSYKAIGEEAGYSRLYAGIHYLPSAQAGLWQGRKVADNIIDKLFSGPF